MKIELIKHDKNSVTVKDIVQLYVDNKDDIETMQHIVSVKALPERLIEHLWQQVEQLGK